MYFFVFDIETSLKTGKTDSLLWELPYESNQSLKRRVRKITNIFEVEKRVKVKYIYNNIARCVLVK